MFSRSTSSALRPDTLRPRDCTVVEGGMGHKGGRQQHIGQFPGMQPLFREPVDSSASFLAEAAFGRGDREGGEGGRWVGG